MAIGDQSLAINDTNATGSAEFATHRSDRIVVTATMSSGAAYVRVLGKSTEAQTTGGALTSWRYISSTYPRAWSFDQAPFAKLTVEWKSNTGSLTADAYVGSIR
jgi:hypothetical protein